MTKEKYRIEGVVIRAVPFKDYDCILSLFTREEGLIKFVVKGAYHAKNGKGSVVVPLSLIEAIYSRGRSELYSCSELAMINPQHSLRQSLPFLEGACEMLKAIEATQLPGKVSSELYQLLLVYLKKLPESIDTKCVSASFYLKTLNYEGLLSSALFPMNEEDRQMVEVLTLCRDFKSLAQLSISPFLANQIKEFFYQSVQNV